MEVEPEERIETVTTTTIQPQYIIQSQVSKQTCGSQESNEV